MRRMLILHGGPKTSQSFVIRLLTDFHNLKIRFHWHGSRYSLRRSFSWPCWNIERRGFSIRQLLTTSLASLQLICAVFEETIYARYKFYSPCYHCPAIPPDHADLVITSLLVTWSGHDMPTIRLKHRPWKAPIILVVCTVWQWLAGVDCCRFLQRVSIAIVNPSVCPSVRLSVCQTLALCQNDSSYDHAVFTGG